MITLEYSDRVHHRLSQLTYPYLHAFCTPLQCFSTLLHPVFALITSSHGYSLVPSPPPHPPLHIAMPTGAVWTSTKEPALVEFLVENRSEAGNRRNFKSPTFQQAVAHIAPLLKEDPVKTVKSARNKWTAVCLLSRFLLVPPG